MGIRFCLTSYAEPHIMESDADGERRWEPARRSGRHETEQTMASNLYGEPIHPRWNDMAAERENERRAAAEEAALPEPGARLPCGHKTSDADGERGCMICLVAYERSIGA